MSQDLFATLRARVVDALREAVPGLDAALAARVEVTPTREAAHGDVATNAAMVAGKAAGRRPAELAGVLAGLLAGGAEIAAAAVAGPGFVNLRLRPEALRAQVPAILLAGEAAGSSEMGRKMQVNVEYVSTNPTGPMHVGHCRGAVIGDALAALLEKAGYDVTREFYVNDAGAQVVALAWAAYWRYLEALGSTMGREAFAAASPAGLQYGGDYLVPVGKALAARYGDGLAGPGLGMAAPAVWLEVVRDFAVGAMMETIRADLAALGVRQEVFTSERALVEAGAAERALDVLEARGLIYRGVLAAPKGKLPEDWEAREQTLFRSTTYGDDVDRPLRKSDGSNTYFANDVGYHADKLRRGAAVVIDVLGADHGGYVSRMRAAVRALDPDVMFEVVLCQIVRIIRGGEAVRMSKRAGTFETVRDLLDEVGRDAVRFTMLGRKPDAQMEFDLDLAVAQTRENPVFYVQYAHARCRSVLRAATAQLGEAALLAEALARAELGSLEAEAELGLLRRLAGWTRLVEGAALAREPHRVAFYLYELAGDFHMLWNRGRDDATLRFLQEGRPEETLARLALVSATAVVLCSGLKVLGVTPAEEMR